MEASDRVVLCLETFHFHTSILIFIKHPEEHNPVLRVRAAAKKSKRQIECSAKFSDEYEGKEPETEGITTEQP